MIITYGSNESNERLVIMKSIHLNMISLEEEINLKSITEIKIIIGYNNLVIKVL